MNNISAVFLIIVALIAMAVAVSVPIAFGYYLVFVAPPFAVTPFWNFMLKSCAWFFVSATWLMFGSRIKFRE